LLEGIRRYVNRETGLTIAMSETVARLLELGDRDVLKLLGAYLVGNAEVPVLHCAC
jgi:hypothetical protein